MSKIRMLVAALLLASAVFTSAVLSGVDLSPLSLVNYVYADGGDC